MTTSSLMKMPESFPIWYKNAVGKGEFAQYKQVLLFPQCFKQLVLQTRKKPGLVWKRVNPFTTEEINFSLAKNTSTIPLLDVETFQS